MFLYRKTSNSTVWQSLTPPDDAESGYKESVISGALVAYKFEEGGFFVTSVQGDAIGWEVVEQV